MDGKISNKISFLSLIMIVGVIMYHSDLRYLSEYATILSMVIMPYFFAVSGFFAVRGLTRANCFERIKKRVKTLLIPYILWNLVQVIYYLIGSGFSYRLSFKEAVNSLLFSPMCIPSWYLFSLFIIILFLPLYSFFFTSKTKGTIGLVLSFIIAFAAYSWFVDDLVKLGTAGGFIVKTIQYSPAFTLGAYATLFDEKTLSVSTKRALITIPVAVCALLGLCLSFGKSNEIFIFITNIYPLIFWEMHPESLFTNKKVTQKLTDPCMFLCMSHIMMCEIVKRIGCFPNNIRFELIVLPVAVVITYALYYILQRYLPWVIGPLTGGRAVKKVKKNA